MTENYSFRSAVGGFNRNDVMGYVRDVLEEQQKLKDRIAALEQDLQAKTAGEAELNARIGELEKECEKLKSEKNDVTKLGAAMVDARRFSDQLVQEANDQVNEIYGVASEAVASAETTLSELTDHMGTVSGEINVSLSDVRSRLSELSRTLIEFSEVISGGQEEFNRRFPPLSTADASDPETDDALSGLLEQARRERVLRRRIRREP